MHIIKRLRQKHSIPLLGLLLAVFASLVTVSTGLAWGPDRTTYTIEKPADHVVFDSITNNPVYGDERNFIRLKDASLGDSTYADDTKIEPGKEYVAYIYFHNNASTTFNDAAHNYSGVAKNAKLRIALPTVLEAGKRTGMTAYLSADNASPQAVYDDTFMTATESMTLKYVPGSAVIYSKGAVNGQKLDDAVVTDGAFIGYDKLDGSLPGCDEYSGYVLAHFVASQPNFSVTKQVSATGQNKWGKDYAAKLGDTVDFLVTYKNIGNVQQDNVVVRDLLPKGLTYVDGSSVLANSVSPKGAKTDDGATSNGLNIGSYAPNGNAFLKFSAKVADKIDACGQVTLKNIATISTDNGNKNDTATVTVTVECKPAECKPGIPVGDAKCKEPSVVTGTTPDTTTPSTPSTTAVESLPSTGPAETFAVLAVLVAIAAFVTYHIQRRHHRARAAFAADHMGMPTHELLGTGEPEQRFVRKDDIK